MSKFILGKITVQTISFDVDKTKEELVDLGNNDENWKKGSAELPTDAKIEEYAIGWTEGGALNPERERNVVLAAFLNLMNELPKAEYAKPRIITLDPG